MLRSTQGLSTGSATFGAYRIDHHYGVLRRTCQGGVGMKRWDYFCRRQEPAQRSGGWGLFVIPLARNDRTGWRGVAVREIRTARKLKGGSDPGVIGS